MEEVKPVSYEEFTPNPKYLTKSYLISAIASVIFLIPLSPFAFFVVPELLRTIFNLTYDQQGMVLSFVPLFIIVIYGLLVTLGFFFNRLQYRALSYHITDSEIVIKQGVIFKRQVVIPFRTVTNIDTIIGPIDRLFGLGTVNIQTAGAMSVLAEGRFVGLLQPEAENLRNYLKNRLQRLQGGSPGTAMDDSGSDSTEVELVLTELRSIRKVLEEIRDQK